jgi:hypothetical protein
VPEHGLRWEYLAGTGQKSKADNKIKRQAPQDGAFLAERMRMDGVTINNETERHVRISGGLGLWLHVIISAVAVGTMYTTIQRDIAEQGRAIQDIQQRRTESSRFENEALQRLARMETTLDDLKERIRGKK